MKKFIFKNFQWALLFGIFITNTAFGYYSYNVYCPSKPQAAVNLKTGECEIFASICDLSNEFQAVRSCDEKDLKDIVLPDFGVSRDEKDDLDRKRLLKNFEEAAKEEDKRQIEATENSPRLRLGPGRFSRSTWVRQQGLVTKPKSSYFIRKTTTNKNYSQEALETFKNRTIRGGYNRDKNEDQPKKRMRRVLSRVFLPRSGSRKYSLNWNVKQKSHMTEKSYTKNPFKRRSNKLKTRRRRYWEGPKQIKVFKGERLEGEVDILK